MIAANIFAWQAIIYGGNNGEEALYFLNIGQGDASLIDLGKIEILMDGGKGPQVLSELTKALGPTDRYIDLVIATHPDFDHFGGLIDVLKTYKVGAVITNGRDGVAEAYADFIKAAKESGAKELVLKEGDKISYKKSVLDILAPSPKDVNGKSSNNSGIVFLLKTGSVTALYTADIDFEKELELVRRYDIRSDILKVAHHGSKYSSSKEFLKEVQPKVSLISVGKNNYGHPTSEALNRLASVNSLIEQTNQEGTIKISLGLDRLAIYSIK
ncbi:MAG: MBL fold metallo-hydrolase [Patescibacteria group bacterium]